jgi:3-deoxy-7-phosphoheptulonate synthase
MSLKKFTQHHRKPRTSSPKPQTLVRGAGFTLIAGPCAAESEQQVLQAARAVKKAGADIFRANLYKPRTEPESFQGCGDIGFTWLAKAREKINIPVATEVRTPAQLDLALKHKIDLVWVGARNCQNYDFLIYLGQATAKNKTPIMLKRGMAMRLKEWLGSARYIIQNGNPHVWLCERGIASIDPNTTRNLLDLQTAWLAQQESGLPVIIDPSHAAGRVDLITPMSKAAKAAGLAGLIIEVHPQPRKALSDPQQQLTPKEFAQLTQELKEVK